MPYHTPVVVQSHVDAATISFASSKYAYACLQLPEQAKNPSALLCGGQARAPVHVSIQHGKQASKQARTVAMCCGTPQH